MSGTSRTILMVAHHFPPMGGPGTNRSLQLARYLHEMGYKLHILTVAESDIQEGAYPLDPSRLDEIPEGVKVHRVSIRYPQRFRNFMIRFKLFRLFWFFAYPWFWEPAARWVGSAVPVAEKLIEEHGIDLVYTSSGPFTAAQIGYKLRKRMPIKWVSDLRDPFTDAYFFTWPSKIHWYACRWMEKRIYRRADKLVVNTPAVKRLYLQRGLVAPEQITVITNGYGEQ